MNKTSFAVKAVIIFVLCFCVPTGLFYHYDKDRLTQLNNMQAKLEDSSNKEEKTLIRDQTQKKTDEAGATIFKQEQAAIAAKYSRIISNNVIRNFSYTKQQARIKTEFLKLAKFPGADLALIMAPGGRVVEATNQTLKAAQFRTNRKFSAVISSRQAANTVDFTDGTAEYFLPIIDSKDNLTAVLYVKEDISEACAAVRKNTQSKNGSNFIIKTSGTIVLHTDRAKENNENILSNPDMKAVLNEADSAVQVREVEYNNLRGLLGSKKSEDLEAVVCVFTPYTDYKSIKKETKKFTLSMFDTTFVVPVYGLLALALLTGILLIYIIAGEPFTPVRKIVKALTHIDEESFPQLLPNIKSGEYKKLLDSLLILRGRVKASDEKADKLSRMAKELEEELSKEASRADAEISQVRDALKIAENGRASADEEAARARKEAAAAKKEAEAKVEAEKSALNQKIYAIEKELEKARQEVKKSQESKVPVEKENMRMDSVLMMNTELKGVLSVIKTYISSVLGGEGKITDAQQQFLGVVINKSARLERLINDLTELSRLEKGEIKLNRTPIEINTITQDVIFGIQPQADIKKVEIKTIFAPTLPTGLGDSARLSSVISQLMNQAIKVSPRGGQVIIETKEDKGGVLIRITDFGMSMVQAKSSQLFINFHGPESVAGPEFINSGLRFPIIKAVMTNMGGDIWIESEIGKGKTFVLSIPKVGGEGKQPQAPKAAAVAPAVKPDLTAQEPGFRIQRNDAGAENKIDTVSDLLSMTTPVKEADKKPVMPGKDAVVPPELLKKEGVPPASGGKPPTSLDALPPLPDLEDDQGIIT
ncbi:MAG: HAMP domain-containing histidine kinase [Spirochaetia bacterium]|nr:HAMP domain-containing histidine kinase [Spirochaetia bacterium]